MGILAGLRRTQRSKRDLRRIDQRGESQGASRPRVTSFSGRPNRCCPSQLPVAPRTQAGFGTALGLASLDKVGYLLSDGHFRLDLGVATVQLSVPQVEREGLDQRPANEWHLDDRVSSLARKIMGPQVEQRARRLNPEVCRYRLVGIYVAFHARLSRVGGECETHHVAEDDLTGYTLIPQQVVQSERRVGAALPIIIREGFAERLVDDEKKGG